MKHFGASLLLLLAFSVSACGDDRTERGLAVPDEESTPESAAEMKKTDQQRKEVLQEEQHKEIEDFDAAEK